MWLIVTHEMTAAFVLFLLAGVSDAADGYLAKRFQWRTELGSYLDPIADKLLLMSIYVTLGFSNHLPAWLVIAVVSRDILIIGAFLLSWVLSRPVPHPSAAREQGQHASPRSCWPGWCLPSSGSGLAGRAGGGPHSGDRRAHHPLCRCLFPGMAQAYGEL